MCQHVQWPISCATDDFDSLLLLVLVVLALVMLLLLLLLLLADVVLRFSVTADRDVLSCLCVGDLHIPAD